MDEASKYECKDHEITFPNAEALRKHKSECADLLKQKNVCTYVDVDGECCAKSFDFTALLILHMFLYHGRYACECCYGNFPTCKELAEHEHDPKLNVRTRKWIKKNFFNPSVSNNYIKK